MMPLDNGMRPIVTKRPHRKVRTGCLPCKGRKIKCDEKKPECSACIRYHDECTWPAAVQQLLRLGRISSGTTPNLPEEETVTLSERLAPPGATSSAASAFYPKELIPHTSNLNLDDLSLLHHWCTVVYAAFGDQPGDELVWQKEIPKLASEHPFLMHGLLGVAALHLRRVDSANGEKHLLKATYHQLQALPAYRYVLDDIEHCMTQDNCTAVVAFSILMAVYGFACPHSPDSVLYPALCSDTGVPEWIQFVLGCRKVIARARPWLAQGALAFELRDAPESVDKSLNPDDEHLVDLNKLFDEMEKADVDGEAARAEVQTYRDTLELLRFYSAMPYKSESELGVKASLWRFVEKLPQAFIELLGQLRPGAIILLAHACVLVKKASCYWFMATSAERVLDALYDILDPKWKHWIGWPLEKTQVNAGRQD